MDPRPASLPFPNPPYAHLVGNQLFVCAQRATDHVVECSNGVERPFVPVRKLTTALLGRYAHNGAPEFRGWPIDEDYIVPLCGITYDHRIHCDSPYYDNIQHVLDALP